MMGDLAAAVGAWLVAVGALTAPFVAVAAALERLDRRRKGGESQHESRSHETRTAPR